MGRTAGFVRVAEFGANQDNFIMTSRKEKGKFCQLPCIEFISIFIQDSATELHRSGDMRIKQDKVTYM